jgi:hypothetical protein
VEEGDGGLVLNAPGPSLDKPAGGQMAA